MCFIGNLQISYHTHYIQIDKTSWKKSRINLDQEKIAVHSVEGVSTLVRLSHAFSTPLSVSSLSLMLVLKGVVHDTSKLGHDDEKVLCP